MKNRIFFGGMLAVLLIEAAVLILFALPGKENLQDTVAVNETAQAVQNDWADLTQHRSRTDLDYVVLDLDGTVLYKTRSGLSESINAAIRHRDTIVDIAVGGATVGKLLVANNVAQIF